MLGGELVLTEEIDRYSTYLLGEIYPELQANGVRLASLMDWHFSMDD